MDKYNIISPTTDLSALDNDMYNWYTLPFNVRMVANDDCQKIYGCDVNQLYKDIRSQILHNRDRATIDVDNIVSEYYSIFDYDLEEDSRDKVSNISRQLQFNPYIVLIDPDIKSLEELSNRYNSYILLDNKNRVISDYHSYKLYGVSVMDMYLKMTRKLTDIELDDDNCITVDENAQLNNIEHLVDNDRYFLMEAMYNNDEDIVNNYIIETENSEDSYAKYLRTNIINEIRNINFYNNINYIPMVPMIMSESAIEFYDENYTYNISKLLNEFKHDKSIESAIVEAGWNPYIPICNKSVNDNKSSFIHKLSMYHDISRHFNEDVEIDIEKDPNKYPVYISFIKTTKSDDEHDTYEVAISLKSDIQNNSYGVRLDKDGNFIGFKKLLIADIANSQVTVYCIHLSANEFDNVADNIKYLSDNIGFIPGFKSIFAVIANMIKQDYSYTAEYKRLVLTSISDFINRLSYLDSINKKIDTDSYQYRTQDVYTLFKDGIVLDCKPERLEYLAALVDKEKPVE